MFSRSSISLLVLFKISAGRHEDFLSLLLLLLLFFYLNFCKLFLFVHSDKQQEGCILSALCASSELQKSRFQCLSLQFSLKLFYLQNYFDFNLKSYNFGKYEFEMFNLEYFKFKLFSFNVSVCTRNCLRFRFRSSKLGSAWLGYTRMRASVLDGGLFISF